MARGMPSVRLMMERAVEVMRQSVAEPRSDGKASPLEGYPATYPVILAGYCGQDQAKSGIAQTSEEESSINRAVMSVCVKTVPGTNGTSRLLNPQVVYGKPVVTTVPASCNNGS